MKMVVYACKTFCLETEVGHKLMVAAKKLRAQGCYEEAAKMVAAAFQAEDEFASNSTSSFQI